MPTRINGFDVYGAIEQRWLAAGGASGSLGLPLSNEVDTVAAGGRTQNFERGIVSWHPLSGAHIVWGDIGVRWIAIRREEFGFPITDELPTGDRNGRFNHFRAFRADGSVIGESSIFWSLATRAHEVYGGIRDLWAGRGWEHGSLGYPLAAEEALGANGRRQRFQHGMVIWFPNTGALVDPIERYGSIATPRFSGWYRFLLNVDGSIIFAGSVSRTNSQTHPGADPYKVRVVFTPDGGAPPIVLTREGVAGPPFYTDQWTHAPTAPNDTFSANFPSYRLGQLYAQAG